MNESQTVCPRCRLAMNKVTFRRWEVQLCPRCEGTFYDQQTLDTLLQQPDLRLSYLRPALLPNLSSPHPEEVDRARNPCPQCHQEMTREGYSEETPLLVDRCKSCCSIWLDDGELGHLFEERVKKHPHPRPGFVEGLRRLVGMTPRVSTRTAPQE